MSRFSSTDTSLHAAKPTPVIKARFWFVLCTLVAHDHKHSPTLESNAENFKRVGVLRACVSTVSKNRRLVRALEGNGATGSALWFGVRP